MEAKPSDKPDGFCPLCGDSVRLLRATGKILCMDGTSHDDLHVRRLRSLGTLICDTLWDNVPRKEISDVEVAEKRCDGFAVVYNGVKYFFVVARMEPVKR